MCVMITDKAGWRLETIVTHNRNDKYYFPPGVTRGPGHMVRRDFFDSAKQVRNCLDVTKFLLFCKKKTQGLVYGLFCFFVMVPFFSRVALLTCRSYE